MSQTPENTTTPPFPLDQWFDITKPIPISEADLVEAQMALYAIKDGLEPHSSECQQEYRAMRKAVAKHNAQFPPPPPPVPRRKTAKQLAIIKAARPEAQASARAPQ